MELTRSQLHNAQELNILLGGPGLMATARRLAAIRDSYTAEELKAAAEILKGAEAHYLKYRAFPEEMVSNLRVMMTATLGIDLLQSRLLIEEFITDITNPVGKEVARELQKSEQTNINATLPTVDTAEDDRKWKERLRKERESTYGDSSDKDDDKKKKTFSDRFKKKNVVSRKYVTEKVKRLSGIMVTKYRDGSIYCKPQNSPPPGYDPGFDTSQQEKMLSMAIDYLKTSGPKPKEKAKDQQEKPDQKPVVKSLMLPRSKPITFKPKSQENHTMQKSAPIDREPFNKALAELDRIESINLGSDGHQMAARKTGLDLSKLPAGTDLTKMDIKQMRAMASEQAKQSIAHVTAAHAKLYRR